jgi:hypothetical protein
MLGNFVRHFFRKRFSKLDAIKSPRAGVYRLIKYTQLCYHINMSILWVGIGEKE